MKFAILDNDEKTAALAELLEKLDGEATLNRISEADLSAEGLRDARYDAVFLNADLPRLEPVALAEQLAERSPQTALVFLSDHPTLAVDAFRVNALDYLVTPVTADRLHITLDRLKDRDAPAGKARRGRISVRVFGKLSVLVEGAPVHWQTAKSAELFIYLLFHRRDAGLDKWRIINDLWGEKNKEDADVNFRSTLYRMNKTLRKYGAGECVRTLRGAYRLDCGELDVDAFRMDRYARLGFPLAEEALPELEGLLLSFDGDVLGGNDFVWSYPTSENYRFLFNQLSKNLCLQYINQGKYIQAEGIVSNYLKVDAFDEEVHILKLKIMKQTGRLHEADQYVKKISELYRAELGLEVEKRLAGYLR